MTPPPPPGAARRRWLGIGIALGAAAAGVGTAVWRSQRNAARATAQAREQAFWQLSFDQPDGSRLQMADLRGRPLLVNFWATWCPPCVKEMPLLDAFAKQNAGRGWRVVGIAIDQLDPVREFLQRVPVGFPIALAGMEGAALSRELGNAGGQLPYSVVFDREGRIEARHLGAVDEALLNSWLERIG